jgi:hypothetical protein
MKSFLERLAGGRGSFRDLGMGETAALSLGTKERVSWYSPISKAHRFSKLLKLTL